MMKFNVEVDIDWIDEESNLDDAVKDGLINGLARKIEGQFSEKISAEIANTATKFIQAKTELIINTTLEKPIAISEGWNNKTEYNSIYEMIEQKMTKLYEGKIDSNGTCKEDPLLSSIKKYVDSSVNKTLTDVRKIVEKTAAAQATKAIKGNELIKALSSVVTIQGGAEG